MAAPLAPFAMILMSALGGLSGCGHQGEGRADTAFEPVYDGIQTRLLDWNMVNFQVEMEGARSGEDVVAYSRCAAAQYSLIRGYGFARHVRTNVTQEGGNWQADAVYTISPALPRGVRTIDAEVTVADCREQGIPTV